MMKKQEAQRVRQRPQVRPAPQPHKERTKPRQFVKEVGGELRKVNWPSRQEVMAYSWVVLVGVIVISAFIFGLDYVFTKAILALFGVET
jgi:preprotein translocase subunit SecE